MTLIPKTYIFLLKNLILIPGAISDRSGMHKLPGVLIFSSGARFWKNRKKKGDNREICYKKQ